jgi:hypothetical protein
MITPFKLMDIVYTAVKNSSLATEVTGDIYKLNRPFDSKTEDIIINTLTVGNQAVQTGIVNVNIHVKNVLLGNGSNQDNTHADFPRMDQLTELFRPVLNGVYIDQVWFEIQNINIIPEENIPEHFINFRIVFFTKNV